MNITRVETIDESTLLDMLRTTKLRGHGQYQIYEHADLSLEMVGVLKPFPTQRYVLESGVATILDLHRELRRHHKIDNFLMRGGVWFWFINDQGEEEGPVPLLPPILEESHEPDGTTVLLINDGMHRIYAAQHVLRPALTAVVVRNVPKEHPYYAYPLINGWASVQMLRSVSDDFKKKAYRNPDDYKALFRDFNAVFPGVQKARTTGSKT